MKILIAGDSITEGITGISYINLLKKEMPNAEIINLGLGGDTIIGIGNRILEHLKETNDYTAIVIEAGHNDILLPILETQAVPYRLIAKSLMLRGSLPIEDPDVFEGVYRTVLKVLFKHTKAKVFVSTLTCIGEDLTLKSNYKRKIYNENIKKLAESLERPVTVIDVASKFDRHLESQICRPYLLDDVFKNFLKEAHKTMSDETSLEISKERGLHLTIDGIHLNRNGADLYAKAFYSALNME